MKQHSYRCLGCGKEFYQDPNSEGPDFSLANFICHACANVGWKDETNTEKYSKLLIEHHEDLIEKKPIKPDLKNNKYTEIKDGKGLPGTDGIIWPIGPLDFLPDEDS